MQLFYFTSAKYGLENVAKRRIKISRFSQLNDPFELLANGMSDNDLRKAFRELRDDLNSDNGLICFSERWSNPVMWSHYGEKHRGICLGFKVKPEFPTKVTYRQSRLRYTKDDFAPNNPANKKAMLDCLTTKFSHWRYEREWRVFQGLDHTSRDSNGNYFCNLDETIKLTHIIDGAESAVSKSEIECSITQGEHDGNEIDCFKARTAFKTFSVVRNRNTALWR
jgi:Protein of unknown function (DUF2971)